MNEDKIKKLLDDHKKLIEYEASKYSSRIPSVVVQAEAYKLARKAAEAYNPATGVKFSTFLTNSLQKLSRMSTQYGGTIRVPENKQFKLHKINQLEAGLKAELGRDPTVHELSESSGLPLAALRKLLVSRKKDVNVMNLAYTPAIMENENDDWVHFVYHDLTDRDKVIFEYKTGFGGKPVLTNEQIAAKMETPVSMINSRVRFITDRLSEAWK